MTFVDSMIECEYPLAGDIQEWHFASVPDMLIVWGYGNHFLYTTLGTLVHFFPFCHISITFSIGCHDLWGLTKYIHTTNICTLLPCLVTNGYRRQPPCQYHLLVSRTLYDYSFVKYSTNVYFVLTSVFSWIFEGKRQSKAKSCLMEFRLWKVIDNK